MKYLKKISKIILVEDKRNVGHKTIGECLEYFLSEKMCDIICAYIKVDIPYGFASYGLGIITNIIKGVNSTSLLT